MLIKKRRLHETEAERLFFIKIQVVGGNLTAENIKAVAEVAEKYGKGYVHMTSRQGVKFLSLILKMSRQ